VSSLSHGELMDEMAHFAAGAIVDRYSTGAEWAGYLNEVVRSLKDGH